MAKCKACKAEIKFISTPSGRLTPIDTKMKMIWCYIDNKWQTCNGYESHFATCPEADKFRRKLNGHR